MNVSFCIITGGKRSDTINLVINSIRAQKITTHEIIIAGKHHDEPRIIYLPAADAADNGMLGIMRNLAVSRAQHDNIVLLLARAISLYGLRLQENIPDLRKAGTETQKLIAHPKS